MLPDVAYSTISMSSAEMDRAPPEALGPWRLEKLISRRIEVLGAKENLDMLRRSSLLQYNDALHECFRRRKFRRQDYLKIVILERRSFFVVRRGAYL